MSNYVNILILLNYNRTCSKKYLFFKVGKEELKNGK